MNKKEALQKIIDEVGGRAALATELKITTQAVSRMVARGQASSKRLGPLVVLSNGLVTREQLRPDLFCE